MRALRGGHNDTGDHGNRDGWVRVSAAVDAGSRQKDSAATTEGAGYPLQINMKSANAGR
jgi:hypothetical protein